MRDGTAEPVSQDQILRRERGQGNVYFSCSADYEQDWQPYPVDPYSADSADHTYIHTYMLAHIHKYILYRLRYFLYRTYSPHTSSGCGKREAGIDRSIVKPEKAAPVTDTTLRTTDLVPADSRQ